MESWALFMRHSSPSAYKPFMRHLLLSLFLALGLAVAPTWADGHKDHERARQALTQGQVLPLRTVLEKVEGEHPGQVLKIEFEQDDGRYVYEIRLLQADGRIAKLKVDAMDGKVLEIKQKRGR